MKSSLIEGLGLLGPTILEICRVSGTPGVSIGVLHQGQVIHEANYGFRDVEKKLPPDHYTIYHIASLTKTFTAAAAGILVDDGQVKWDTPISQILSEFELREEYLTKNVTILDVVSNRLGITSGGSINSHGGNRVWLAKKDLFRTLKHFEIVSPFRSSFRYNNHAFAIIPEIVERLTGQSFGTFLIQRIFNPLGMNRSVIRASDSPVDNLAVPYATLDDASPYRIPPPQAQDGNILAAAGGVRSCVSDLLIFYRALMQAANMEYTGSQECPADNPLRQISTMFGSHVQFSPNSPLESAYGAGLARTRLPNTFGKLGLNGLWVEKMPVIGGSAPAGLVHWHQGSYPGFLSSAFLLPDSESAIVVLTNSLALNDAADWIGQLLLQKLSGGPDNIDFVALASQSRKRNLARNDDIARKIKENRRANTKHQPLPSYVGRYWNEAKSFFIQISLSNGENGLVICFQGEDWDTYELRHYDGETFEWHLTREEQAKRARWPRMNINFWQFVFHIDAGDGSVNALNWVIDPFVPAGNVFTKETMEASAGAAASDSYLLRENL